MGTISSKSTLRTEPSLFVSVIPLIVLLASLIGLIIVKGADSVQDYSYYILLMAAGVSLLLGRLLTDRHRCMRPGIAKSARQILPAVPILVFIGTLSATWMLSGVVPTLIVYGLELLDVRTFLFVACAMCAAVSVVTGSSWTTIATLGVALMGVGSVMGFSHGWVAGAIISGAYFGDKVSPLSDTTVLAASSCGVRLFTHIRYLMLTSAPAMAISLTIYLIVGFCTDLAPMGHTTEMLDALHRTFNITPWTLVIPALTLLLILLRFSTAWTLAIGSLAGLVGIWILQPSIVEALTGSGASLPQHLTAAIRLLATSTALETGNDLLDPLVSTGGIQGMLPTIWLVLSAMIFGGVMIATGMLGCITRAITCRLRRARSLVGATVGSGLFLNCCTGDQYLSIIVGANIYRSTYHRRGLKPQVLSRTLEDSISVTSVLIPWNSCGVTQSTVLGVATLTYLPFCLFNYISPLMTIAMAWAGWRIHRPLPTPSPALTASL